MWKCEYCNKLYIRDEKRCTNCGADKPETNYINTDIDGNQVRKKIKYKVNFYDGYLEKKETFYVFF